MVDMDKVAELVKSCLPRVTDDVVRRIAQDIVSDVEPIMHSLIRQAVAQERQQLFLNSYKNW